jgi:CRISPR/Cas system-associated exonuclease Cas4 (RecB family)
MGISRTDFFTRLGVISPGPDLDSITEQAYLFNEEQERERIFKKKPRGRAFFASMFPGGENERRCARQALYSMMDVPDPKPISPTGRAVIEMGKAAERQIVWRWGKMGLLLGVKLPKYETDFFPQAGFEDKEYWLSGNADAVLDLRPSWEWVLPVDVKSKADDKINKMRLGELPPYEDDHYKQLQAYLYLCRKFHSYMRWDKIGLKPAKAGFIYYVSRDNPRNTWSAYVPYNEEFVVAGLQRLTEWRKAFLDDTLPERPKEWRWTEQPCKWCSVKKACKQDIKDDVTRLSESNAIESAAKINAHYDPDRVREEVMRRWDSTPMQP